MAPIYHLVQSLIKALAILEVLSERADGMGVTEISERVGMNKSTVHRILTTLVHENYAEQDEARGCYRTTFKLFEIARKILNNVSVTKVARPLVEKLASETGESVGLIIPNLENARLVVCDAVPTSKPVIGSHRLGESLSLSRSAAGKTFLAGLRDNEIKKLMDEKGRRIVLEDDTYSFAQLSKDLRLVRESGIAYDISQTQGEKMYSVAAPIRDEFGAITALIDISWPAHRNRKNLEAKNGKIVREMALEVSRRLGYIPG